MDCEDSCPLPDKIPEVTKPLQIADIDILIISSAALFCLIILTFATYVIYFKSNYFDFNNS
jgi:hypothetical protein